MRDRIMRLVNNKWFLISIRVVLGGLFITASIGKIQNPANFVDTVIGYGVLPEGLAAAYGWALPWVELFIGCALVLGVLVRFTAALSVPVIVSFIVASSFGIINSLSASCGCFGAMVSLSHPVSIALDCVMLSLALLVVFRDPEKDILSIGSLLDRYKPSWIEKWLRVFSYGSRVGVVALAMVMVFFSIQGAQLIAGSGARLHTGYTEINGEITENVDQALEADGVALLFFYTGCSSCTYNYYINILDNLQAGCEGDLYYYFVNYGDYPEYTQQLGIAYSPTIVLITEKNGQGQYLIYRYYVGLDKEALVISLDNLFN